MADIIRAVTPAGLGARSTTGPSPNGNAAPLRSVIAVGLRCDRCSMTRWQMSSPVSAAVGYRVADEEVWRTEPGAGAQAGRRVRGPSPQGVDVSARSTDNGTISVPRSVKFVVNG
jgi:hypothetical protein